MHVFRAILSILLSLASVSWAAEQDVIPALDTTNPAALQEATRVLEEEIKLAVRPQTYVVIDLEAKAILIKSRGVELHHLPIESWSASHLSQLATAYRLRERPPVNRRKIDPVAEADEQAPISLADMPTMFTLQFSPPLAILVLSHTDGNPWQWATQRGRAWWHRLKSWGFTLYTGGKPASSPSLHLIISLDHAQSLAWTVTEGMPFLIRRATTP
jgi:hypothetical protein